MSRNLVNGWTRLPVVAVLLLSGGLFVSCPVEQPQVLLVLDNMALMAQSQCMIRPGGGGAQSIRPFGILDLALTNAYWMFPRIRNMMDAYSAVSGVSSSSLLPAETHAINIVGATVNYEIDDVLWKNMSTSQQKNFYFKYQAEGLTFTTSATVLPSEEGVAAVQVIPPELGTLLGVVMQNMVNAGNTYPGVWMTVRLKLIGVTQDRTKVYSNEMPYPVLLCWGCLVRKVCDPNLPPQAGQMPCLVGQDEAIDNCALCPAVALHPEVCENTAY